MLCLRRSVSPGLINVIISTEVSWKWYRPVTPSLLAVIQFFEGSKPDHTKSWLYAVCSLSYLGAMVSSNSALQYVNYPTQVSLSGGADFVCKQDSFLFIHVCVILSWHLFLSWQVLGKSCKPIPGQCSRDAYPVSSLTHTQEINSSISCNSNLSFRTELKVNVACLLIFTHSSAMICVSYSILSHVSVDILLVFVHIM